MQFLTRHGHCTWDEYDVLNFVILQVHIKPNSERPTGWVELSWVRSELGFIRACDISRAFWQSQYHYRYTTMHLPPVMHFNNACMQHKGETATEPTRWL